MLSGIHMSNASGNNLHIFGYLACRLERPGVEPPTLRLAVDLLYLLSSSHPEGRVKVQLTA